MDSFTAFPHNCRTVLLAAMVLAAGSTAARADDWQFGVNLYGWFPGVTGDVTFKNGARTPAGSGRDLDVSADDILNALDFVFLGGFEMRKGDWGAFTDLIYLDLSGNDRQSLNALVPGGPGVQLDAALELKSTIWTLAGQYRVLDAPQVSADAVLGFRYLALDVALDLTLDGPLPPELPTAHLSRNPQQWDGIIGLRGEFRPGGDWILPYYVDVGTGDSSLTWQALFGVGYRFDWGDIVLAYRHLDYAFDDSAKVDLDLGFSGAGLGATFRF
ncbi:hypothetical protein CKO42_10765 [Lamprobacter modestohalophilus]|uniref:Outer membrane protein beta-barrel domain-containing protein n=1 Tax=Lamprobacter modestohalophilus TaxID=1064514 RepID=A0A9X0W9R8_9GAMM|nr:hypothetical protein [Lamprobacter modestohalophilus]MBK1618903.1 hypothetical protein [Lamprobacter modestohalophilus]